MIDFYGHYYSGDRKQAFVIAKLMLKKHGGFCSESIKALRERVDLSLSECADITYRAWVDMEVEREVERLQAENAKLRELITDVHDMEHDMRDLGVKVGQ